MTSLARRTLPVLVLALVLVPVLGGAASAKVEKFTFTDVLLVDGDGTEISGAVIEANVKQTNKRTTGYCGYFTEGYQESLGYYFNDFTVDPDQELGDQLLRFCQRWFPDRFV
ncbi:MAG TPA: hypothetical protein VF058_02220 [Actinomycetota bacterium]